MIKIQNKNREIKNTSIFKKLSRLMIALIIVQAVIMIVFLGAADITSKINDDAVRLFSLQSKNVKSRFLEDFLSNEEDYVQGIDSMAKRFNKSYVLDINGANQFMNDNYNELIDMMVLSNCSDINITIKIGNEFKNLYIKDSNDVSDKSKSGFEIVSNPNIIANTTVAEAIIDTKKYDELIEIFNKDSKFRSGILSASYLLNSDYEIPVAYSTPIYSGKEIVGFISLNYNDDMMDEYFNKLSKDAPKNLIYSVGYIKDNEYVSFYNSENYKGEYGDNVAPSVARPTSFDSNIFMCDIGNDTLYVSTVDLGESKDSDIDIRWILSCTVKKTELFSSGYTLIVFFFMALLVSFIASLIFVFIISKRVSRPIEKIIENIKILDPTSEEVNTGESEFTEINDLLGSVNNLIDEIKRNASKFSDIIGMVQLPLAAYEYREDIKKVYVTASFFEIMNVKNYDYKAQYIDSKTFDSIMQKLVKYDDEDEHRVIYSLKVGNMHRYIELHTAYNDNMIIGIISDVSEDVRASKQLKYERDHDMLTKLLNRRSFFKNVTNLLERGDDLKTGALIMWDLDNLKFINDKYGHDFGDQYIKLMANILKRFTIYDGEVSRISGDEFYVFLHGFESKEKLRDIIVSIQQEMRVTTLLVPDGKELVVRASGGIAWYPLDATRYDLLMKYADFAMYKAKHTIKGSIAEFDINAYNEEYFLIEGKDELNALFENEDVDFDFQPILNAKDGSIYGYEALMRPKSLVDTPSKLIALANSQHKLYQMERLTWLKALELFSKRKNSKKEKLFLNSIPNSVLNQNDITYIEQVYPELLSSLVVEIMETEDLDSTCLQRKQDFIKKWKAQFAIDDYGSGYSNLNSLLNINASFIKMDYTIIRDIHKDEKCQRLLKDTVNFAHSHDILVIAEGVESWEEAEYLIENDVDLLQGFVLGKPDCKIRKVSTKVIGRIKKLNRHE